MFYGGNEPLICHIQMPEADMHRNLFQVGQLAPARGLLHLYATSLVGVMRRCISFPFLSSSSVGFFHARDLTSKCNSL